MRYRIFTVTAIALAMLAIHGCGDDAKPMPPTDAVKPAADTTKPAAAPAAPAAPAASSATSATPAPGAPTPAPAPAK
jgi:hypothetical protein